VSADDPFPINTLAQAEASVHRAKALNKAGLLPDAEYWALHKRLRARVAHVRYAQKKAELLGSAANVVTRTYPVKRDA